MGPTVSLDSRMGKGTLGKHCQYPSLPILAVWARAANVPGNAVRMCASSFGWRPQELSGRETDLET